MRTVTFKKPMLYAVVTDTFMDFSEGVVQPILAKAVYVEHGGIVTLPEPIPIFVMNDNIVAWTGR